MKMKNFAMKHLNSLVIYQLKLMIESDVLCAIINLKIIVKFVKLLYAII